MQLIPSWLSVRFSLFGLLCLSVIPATGQSLEDILATLQIEEDGSIVSDDELLILEDLVRRPLDLNRIDRKLMEGIPLITSTDVFLILKKRKELESFSSHEQILSIQGLSLFASELLPLVTTVKTVPATNMALRNRWVTSEKDVRILTQQTIIRGGWSGGFLLERDPGERGLADFASGYVIVPIADGMRLVVGDHQLQSGYGLLFGRSIPSIKGYASLTGMGRLGKGLKPYRSSIEYWALRGIALEKSDRKGRWTVSLTASPKDATVDSNRVLSVSTTGLHRTAASLARKHNLREDMALISWQQDKAESGSYGMVLARDRWTLKGSPVVNRSPKTYGSVFGQIESHSLQFFGEMAAKSGTRPSFLGGIILVQKDLRWISSLRRYPSGFQGPRSQPFREWTGSRLNESGIYQAVSLKLGRHRLNAYGDLYKQSSATTEAGRSLRGFEVANTWRYRWRRGQISIRWRREERYRDQEILYPGDKVTESREKESWRLNSSIPVNKFFRVQLQGDRTSVTEGGTSSRGYGVSIKTYLVHEFWQFSLNWVSFKADDYPSRVYVWDLNLPGELRNKTFFPSGHSVASLFRLKTPTGATLSSRIRVTWEYSVDNSLWSKPQWEAGCQIDIAF